MSLPRSLGIVAANNSDFEVQMLGGWPDPRRNDHRPADALPLRVGSLVRVTPNGYEATNDPRQAHAIVMEPTDDRGLVRVQLLPRDERTRETASRVAEDTALAELRSRPLLRLPEPEVFSMSPRERQMATVQGNNSMRLPVPNKAAFNISELLGQQRNMATHDAGLQNLLETLLVAVRAIMQTRGMQYQAVELPALDGTINFAALVYADDGAKRYSVRMRFPIHEAIQIIQDVDPATARVRWRYVVGGEELPLPAAPLPVAASAELIPTRAQRPRRELILEDNPSEP